LAQCPWASLVRNAGCSAGMALAAALRTGAFMDGKYSGSLGRTPAICPCVPLHHAGVSLLDRRFGRSRGGAADVLGLLPVIRRLQSGRANGAPGSKRGWRRRTRGRSVPLTWPAVVGVGFSDAGTAQRPCP